MLTKLTHIMHHVISSFPSFSVRLSISTKQNLKINAICRIQCTTTQFIDFYSLFIFFFLIFYFPRSFFLSFFASVSASVNLLCSNIVVASLSAVSFASLPNKKYTMQKSVLVWLLFISKIHCIPWFAWKWMRTIVCHIWITLYLQWLQNALVKNKRNISIDTYEVDQFPYRMMSVAANISVSVEFTPQTHTHTHNLANRISKNKISHFYCGLFSMNYEYK